MRTIFFLLVLPVGIFGASGQNLVVNPGFEEYYRCPSSFSTESRDFFLPGWSSANSGTPDHFHQCSWSDNDVPFNWAGQANAHSGLGYAGLYTWNNNGKNYREYIQCELAEPLIKGVRYRIGFFFQLSSYSVYATDRIGLIFSDSLQFRKDDKFIKQPVALQAMKEDFFVNSQWNEITSEYVAKGNERVLIIGNFSDDRSTHHLPLSSRRGKSFMLAASAYYYVDDVTVTRLDPLPEIPLAWTDGQTIQPNEVYILKNIQFEFDSFQLLDISFVELDKLVEVLRSRPDWMVELAGHTDDQGSEEYNLTLSQNRAHSVGEYLKTKGIDANRIRTMGYGKTSPLIQRIDEEARSVNRRVEVKFVK